MKLRQIFQKPVDRNIEGVIKADDLSGLRTEVEEYVLTNEIAQRLETFLEAYNNYQGANGAWISGFFGSGKSHLLKMMALLLENRMINGNSVLDLFLPKCGDNILLQASLKKAVAIPSKSILFNIDQKADVISKAQVDALLAVFAKVFDEMCGFYGKQGYIAKFERDLDRRGLYEQFKAEYQKVAGKRWEEGREEAILEAPNIAETYSRLTGVDRESVKNIVSQYRSDYKVSIEDFALQVKEYTDQQGPNFRLNFFVDEVGQYIAGNVKLMTNLQTIAESLATKCQGRAWLIVTAQDEMADLLGDEGLQQSNDFSKIQARFNTRMKLTSKNVAEVIQKRLLQKNAQGETILENVYHQQSNNFGTLFDFSDGSIAYRNFHDQGHFVNSYPFIPYQYELFQSAIKNLSLHDAFEGRHHAVGERSMLAVFQQVVIHVSDHEIGRLATFDLMFEGIRTSLKSQIQSAVITAENNLSDPFAIQVLKALFLVKYIREFKPTLHNITVLMIDRFSCDVIRLRKQVEEALNLLESQTYIQRNGELYEFLTNEEKDIETEIKNTSVETSAVAAELQKFIFDTILRERKIRLEDSSQDFSFTRKLDDQIFGREAELCIHVASPFHEHSGNEETIRMHSMGRDELLVVFPPDSRLMQDLLMLKRTEKYIQQEINSSQQDNIRRILMDKAEQNRTRSQQLVTQVRDLIIQSKLFASGNAIDVASTDPVTKITKGFYELIRRTYPNLRMLRGITYTENDIEQSMRPEQMLPGMENNVITEVEQELLAHIQTNQQGGLRTTFKSLLERFERKPYGWPMAAVQCNIASLAARGKLEIRKDSNILENSSLVSALRNSTAHPNLVIEPQIEFTPAQIRRLKEFFEDFFSRPPQNNEAKELGREFSAALDERVAQLNTLHANRSLYPFLAALSEPIIRLREVTGKHYTYYLREFVELQDDLLNLNETVIAPILSFWNGAPRGVFDEARNFQQAQIHNFDHVSGNEADQLKALLADPHVYQGNKIVAARGLIDTLKAKIADQLLAQKDRAKAQIETVKERLVSSPEFAALDPQQQEEIERAFVTAVQQIQKQDLIAVVRDQLNRFQETEYQRILTKMTQWAAPAEPAGPSEDAGSSQHRCAEKRVKYVSHRSITVPFDKPWLADEGDVDRYLQSLRQAMLNEIANGKLINI